MILTDKLRLLKLISEQPFEEQEAEVLRWLCQEGGLYTERLIEHLGLSQIVLLLSQWHARFRESLSPVPPRGPACRLACRQAGQTGRGLEPRFTVLCAFTSVLDRVVDQAGLNRLLPWAAGLMGLSPNELFDRAARRARSGRNSQGGSLSAVVHDPLDVVAALLYFFRHPPALKPAIGNLTLRHQLEAFLAELLPGQLRQVLGGASAVAADILAELEVEAHFYTMYHSSTQARRHGPLARRLDLEPGQITYHPAQSAGTYHPAVSGTNGGASPLNSQGPLYHPTASSIAFVYQAGFTLGNVQADRADAVIFRRAPQSKNEERPWDRIWLHPALGQAVALSVPDAEDEWLWLPGFVRWWVEGNTLHLAFADEETVRRIAADYHYLILSGLSTATFAPGEGLSADRQGLAARELAAQMRSLAEGRACLPTGTARLPTGTARLPTGRATLHLELGGAASEETIAPLAEAIAGLVPSAGINDNELSLLTSLSDFRVPVSLHKSTVFQRYQRAVALAQRLRLQRLYVHGNDVDLILRQDGSPETMRQEIQADLFAKGVVVLAILQRSLEDWPSHAIQLAPVLLWKGFQALIAFAWDLVDQRGQGQVANSSASPACPACADRADRLRTDLSYFKELVETGYALADSPQGYAVAVVPVMWPTLPPGIYPGGAGDICSSVSLVYAGF